MVNINALWNEYRSRADQLMMAGMREFIYNLESLVDSLFEAADVALENIADGEDIAEQINLLFSAMDQLIDRGSDFVPELYAKYVQELAAAAGKLGAAIEIPSGVIAEIANTMEAAAMMNNYDFIRQIIPPIRSEIGQSFLDAMMTGEGVSEIEDRLREMGLPWSPTGRYSPGERASMIAATEYNRIYERMNDAMAKAADLDHCYNLLNSALSSHSDQCVAATAAGLITVEEMRKQYGMPPRHPRCGCHIQYDRPVWYDESDTTSQLEDVPGWEQQAADYSKTGGRVKQNKDNWRSHLEWENAFFDKVFGR